MTQNFTRDFTAFLLESEALKFGSFTLKSGRQSPYFINAGSFNTGSRVARLGSFYAQAIRSAQERGILGEFDTVFGPAYKGIPLAVTTAMALSEAGGEHGGERGGESGGESGGAARAEVGYTFDRKEVKDHGDGGMFVGTQLTDGMKVLLVDDVMTAGTAVREVVPKLQAAANVEIVGLVLSVDRMEKTKDSDMSAVAAVQEEFGFPVLAIANIHDIIDAARGMRDEDGQLLIDASRDEHIREYFEKYGA
ncbi:orotate phosphoribosyltransferase [Alloscardovia macacae]|uniref:Orotate phosphoribosyltransferase n=1 Tax=Alloscardovia macacae TaxID=1160091 RepID=A0A1Y2T3U5_9BIFI|nr:orotate phosphoribosyltransferase [Alloscardovia macacae]OTA25476.1 orotate phosphoribosyltransferase [Alloscardovia macacae]OTA30145.1 orotate phosphoribosyltransferase [Alloscardovia macacae]